MIHTRSSLSFSSAITLSASVDHRKKTMSEVKYHTPAVIQMVICKQHKIYWKIKDDYGKN